MSPQYAMNEWVGLGEFGDIINSRVFLKYMFTVTQYISSFQ